jgi:hypothetical protein
MVFCRHQLAVLSHCLLHLQPPIMRFRSPSQHQDLLPRSLWTSSSLSRPNLRSLHHHQRRHPSTLHRALPRIRRLYSSRTIRRDPGQTWSIRTVTVRSATRSSRTARSFVQSSLTAMALYLQLKKAWEAGRVSKIPNMPEQMASMTLLPSQRGRVQTALAARLVASVPMVALTPTSRLHSPLSKAEQVRASVAYIATKTGFWRWPTAKSQIRYACKDHSIWA